MKNNFISILITNYNKEVFLKKSLKMICNQNYKNYEIILYDDCSTDRSLKIIQKFKKIKLIKNKKRKSISRALNQINGIIKCFNKSKGKIICLMDADDFFEKNKILSINKYFNENKNLNCVYNLTTNNIKEVTAQTKKSNYMVWPVIFPTSCISFRRSFFGLFKKYIYKNKFTRLEIDARIVIFTKFFLGENNILKKKLTVYNHDPDGITSKIKKYSSIWWIRRYEAFKYLNNIQKVKKNFFIKGYDYYLTSFFANLIRFIYKV